MTTTIRRAGLRGLKKMHRDIMAQEYPRFSDTEMRNRRKLIDGWMDAHELDHVLVYGAWMSGPAVGFFTGWPVTVEALRPHFEAVEKHGATISRRAKMVLVGTGQAGK